VDLIKKHDRFLSVFNTKKDAKEIYEILNNNKIHYLTAGLYPKHRKKVIKDVNDILNNTKDECILISTSLIENGVDFQGFPNGSRVESSLASIIQTAGRIDRLKLFTGSKLYIIDLIGGSSPIGIQQRAIEEAHRFLHSEDTDLDDPDICGTFYKKMYSQNLLDSHNIADAKKRKAFQEINDLFKLIDVDTVSVVVYKEDAEIEKIIVNIKEKRTIIKEESRALQQFTVSLINGKKTKKLIEQGIIKQLLPDLDIYLWEGYYDPILGLDATIFNDY
jgi:CRISPR-associated endonuclease/helicase Cas3